jgi:hypothetical protein
MKRTITVETRTLEVELEGVEIKCYQGRDGVWHGDILLNREIFPDYDKLPARGNRPREDGGPGSGGRWWYDESGWVEGKYYERLEDEESWQALRPKLIDLLCEIALVQIRDDAARLVDKSRRYRYEAS